MSRLAGANAWLFSAAASTPWKAVFGAFWRGLPFPVGELHSDTGSEFLNNHLLRIWGEEITGLTLSRSRPYQKNDNRFVEQKNATLVRAYLGQVRLTPPSRPRRSTRCMSRCGPTTTASSRSCACARKRAARAGSSGAGIGPKLHWSGC